MHGRAARSPLASPQRAGDTLTLDDFSLRGALGTGGTSQVLLVQRKGTAGFYAMKVMPKAALEKSQVQYIVSENQLLQQMTHPFLVRLHAAFQDQSNFYLVLQHHGGGDLAQYMMEHGELEEPTARVVLGGCVLALRYLHEVHSVLYRDLKPENILINHRDGLPVLADLGAAKHLVRPVAPDADAVAAASTHTHIGTPLYMAPELWQVGKRGYGFSVDWWAAGVLLHEMLLGDVPWAEGGFRRQTTVLSTDNDDLAASCALDDLSYEGSLAMGKAFDALELDIAERATALQNGPFQLQVLPEELGQNARDLILALLQTEPTARLGCGKDGGASVAAHPFFADINWTALHRRDSDINLVQQLRPPSADGQASVAAAAFCTFDAGDATGGDVRESGEGSDGDGTPSDRSGRSGETALSAASSKAALPPRPLSLPSSPRGARFDAPTGDERFLEVSPDGKLWSISRRLASMLGLTTDAGDSGALQMLLGRHARTLVDFMAAWAAASCAIGRVRLCPLGKAAPVKD